MRRRAVLASILSSSAVLTIGWQLGSHTQTETANSAASSSTTTPSVPSAGSSGSTPTPTSTTADGVSGTYTGTSVSTRFGNVQVQIVVTNGSITDVVALHLTDAENRSVSISNRAAPVLRTEVLAAQSANVKSVSGATYTSDAYLTSLQSALDQTRL